MDIVSGPELLDRLKRFDSVPLDVDVELHNMNMSVRELLSLEAGSVVKTGKRHGNPLSLRVGGVSLLNAEIVAEAGRATVRVVGLPGNKSR